MDIYIYISVDRYNAALIGTLYLLKSDSQEIFKIILKIIFIRWHTIIFNSQPIFIQIHNSLNTSYILCVKCSFFPDGI